MNKKGYLLFFIVYIIIVSIILLNIDNNEKKEEIYTDKVVKIEESDSYIAYNTFDINKVVEITNSYRLEKGLNKLVLDEKLSLVAQTRAQEISKKNNFSHKRPNGTYYSELFDKYKVESITSGENIARGYISEEEVCIGWKESIGHYKNMTNDRFNKIGIGIYNYEGITYWVQIFSN